MSLQWWRNSPVSRRVHMLRWALPAAILVVVLIYQLVFAAYVHNHFGHAAHTVVELIFFGVVGPAVAWATLSQISRWLTEKERAEQDARAHERHLASITDASADAILSLDAVGLIRSWNRGAAALFGYTAKAVIGQPLDILLVENSSGQWRGRNGPATAQPASPLHFEAVVRAQNGRSVPVEITQTPLPDDSGHPAGASVILRDVTERKAREAALAEERSRIARDLHDGLAQSLYFVALKLDFIRKQAPRDPAQAEEELRALKQTIQLNIQDVRRTIFALRPIDLEGLGFRAAVEKYAREFGEQTSLDIVFEVAGDLDRIPPSMQPHLFRIIQEGLNNIAKHAQARRAWVRIEVTQADCLRVHIRDDGIGFDPEDVAAQNVGKMGLRQMRERVASLHGQLAIARAPDQGTLMRADIPLSDTGGDLHA